MNRNKINKQRNKKKSAHFRRILKVRITSAFQEVKKMIKGELPEKNIKDIL